MDMNSDAIATHKAETTVTTSTDPPLAPAQKTDPAPNSGNSVEPAKIDLQPEDTSATSPAIAARAESSPAPTRDIEAASTSPIQATTLMRPQLPPPSSRTHAHIPPTQSASPPQPEQAAQSSLTPPKALALEHPQQPDPAYDADAAAAILAANKANIKRGRGSCVYCRRRKQRCDPGPTLEAPCEACKRLGKICEYPPNGVHPPRPPPATVLYSAAAATLKSDGLRTTPRPASEEADEARRLSDKETEPQEYGPFGSWPGLMPRGGATDRFRFHHASGREDTQAMGGASAPAPGAHGQGFARMGVGLGIGSVTMDHESPQLPSASLGRSQSGRREKRSRREVDFSSDEEDAAARQTAATEAASRKKQRGTMDFSSDEEHRTATQHGVSLTGSSLSPPSPGLNGGKVAPGETNEDDELMEAVGEGRTAATNGASISGTTAVVNGDGDDEIDELMDEAGDDADKAAKPRSKSAAGGQDVFAEEVEGELLMLADPAPKPRKPSPRRQSGGPMQVSHTHHSARAHGSNGNVPSAHLRNGHHSHRSQRHQAPSVLSPGAPVSYTAAPTVWGPPVPSMFGPMPHHNGMAPPDGQFAGPPEVLSAYAASLQALLPALPPQQTQQILFQQFFSDHFLAQGLALLQPQYTEDYRSLLHRRSKHPPQPFLAGDATTLAVGFAVLATSLRVMPEETSQILLSSVIQTSNPRSFPRILSGQTASPNDLTALHRRYIDHALIASQLADLEDPPSVMQVLLKLILYRYGRLCANSPTVDLITSQPAPPRFKDRMVIIGGWLAQGIKIAQAMGMNREWDGIPLIERELRRRLFWALYEADRMHAFATSFPYTINDAHNTLNMPSPLAEADLYAVAATATTRPAHSTDECPTPGTHLYIIAHLARLVTKLIDTYVINTPAGTSDDLLAKYEISFDQFEEALPRYLAFYPDIDTSLDGQHPYLPAHRVHLLAQILDARISAHRSRLVAYLSPTCPDSRRRHIAGLHNQSLRIQRNARMLEGKYAFRLFDVDKVFEAGVVSGMIYRVDKLFLKHPSGETAKSHQSVEELHDCRSVLRDAIELLNGVLAWPEANYQAQKALIVLRRMLARLDHARPAPVDGKAAIDEINVWLGVWKGSNVEMLLAEAEWRDWERIVEAM